MPNNLPDFLIVGAAKAGTTSLYSYLNQHPSIFMPENKEPKYLVYDLLDLPQNGKGDDLTYELMVKSLEDYKQEFKSKLKQQLCGEASVDYLYYSDLVIPKIKDIIGEPKIIIMLRDPIKRAYSAYNHLVRDLREDLTFEQGLEAEEERIKNNYEFIWHYKACGLYYESVRNYVQAFKDVKIIIFEEFVMNPLDSIREVFEFLDVDKEIDIKVDQIYNKTGDVRHKTLQKLLKGSPNNWLRRSLKKAFNKNTRHYIRYHLERLNLKAPANTLNKTTEKHLQEYYKPEKEKLTILLDKDLNSWT